MPKVEILPSGRFKVRFWLGQKQTSESFDRRRDAELFAAWHKALGSQGALDKLFAGEQAATMPDLDRVAADHIRLLTGVTPGYRLTSQRLWDRTWAPLIGYLPADQIGRDAIAQAINDLALRYSPKSLKNQRGLLFGVLDRCVDLGYLSANPAKRVRLPEGRFRAVDAAHDDPDDDDNKVFLALEEFGRLYWAMSPHYRPLVRFLAGTGCRWGEAVALRVSDVHLDGEASTVRIRRALMWSPDGKYQIGPPKTKKSRRTVTIGAELVEDLGPLTVGRGAKEYVFTAPRGGMISHRTFWSDHWRPAISRAQRCAEHTDPACRCGTAHPKRCPVHEAPAKGCGCPGTLTQSPRIHDLRHSHASWLLEKYPIHVVQARLGHESIQTTVDTYGHLLPDVQVAAAQAARLDFPRPPELG